MKVILNETVGGLGKIGEVVDVADGYARNYLVPKGIAVVATKGAMKEWDQKRTSLARKEAQERSDAQALADMLRDKEITVEAKAGEGGKLYGSVTAKEIATAVEEQLKITVDRKKIEVAESIKEIGTHEATVKLHSGIEAMIKVNVVESKEE